MAWRVGQLLFLEKNLNGKNYMKLLQNDFMPYYENHLPLNAIFQEDNTTPHRYQAVQQYVEKNIIFTIPWPCLLYTSPSPRD